MEKRSIADRVETLEMIVEELRKLPAQIEALDARVASLDARLGSLNEQFLHFRTETRGEFSAVREEMRAGFAKVDEDFVRMREEMRQGDEDTRRYMRVLHEDVIARIAVLSEQFRRN